MRVNGTISFEIVDAARSWLLGGERLDASVVSENGEEIELYDNSTGDDEPLVNDFGEVKQIQHEWSNPIDCNISTNSDSRKGRYNGEQFRQSSFTIMIEANCADMGEIRRVRVHRGSEYLGEFQVIAIEPLSTVGRIKVLV